MVEHFDSLYFTVMILFGASLIADLLWTRRELRRLAAGEMAKKAATQFLWSCIFFSMLSFSLGMAVSGWNWFSTDFMGKCLADAVASSHITSMRRDQGNK